MPVPKPDPALTLTRRLSQLDSKLAAKHAEVDAETEEAASAVTEAIGRLRMCADDSRTRMSIQALCEEDLEDEDLDTGERAGEDQERGSQ